MDQGTTISTPHGDSDIPSKAQQQSKQHHVVKTQDQDTSSAFDQGTPAVGAPSTEHNSADSTPHSQTGGALDRAGLAGLTSSAVGSGDLMSATCIGNQSSGQIDSSSSCSSSDSQDGVSEDSSRGCTSNGRDPQICFDFTKGLCTRGDKCKFSHDIATIVQFNSKEKGICFDYLRNQCHRGLLCRFSHDLSNIAQQCQSFNNNSINGGVATKNRSGSICYDFVKGVCTRGAECRYSHDLTLIARMARTSSGGAADMEHGQGQQTDVCFDFLRGRCSRGDACKYSHNASLLNGLPGFAPGLLPGAFGSPGMMDPSLGAPWPLGAVSPQTAAAAAAAAAAYAAAGSPSANLGNMVNRLGMLGLSGADPAAAAAAALAGQAGALGGMPAATGGFGAMGGGRPPFDPSGLNNRMLADAMHGDALAMFMAMQQHSALMAGAGANFPGARPGPGMPPMSLPPKGPMGHRTPGQPTPEQMMMASAEITRMLEKQASHSPNPLLMQQLSEAAALTSGLPAPHLATTPRTNLPTSAPFAGGPDVNVSELLAAAAAAAAAAASAPMAASAALDLAALQAAAGGLSVSAANPPLLGGSSGSRGPGALGHMMNPAPSAGMPHMPSPGALSGMHQRGNYGAPHHGPGHMSKHQHPMSGHGMGGGPGGIGASRHAQAAAAAAAIAAGAAQGGPNGREGPMGPATDSQGNILPLSRLQEIWSR